MNKKLFTISSWVVVAMLVVAAGQKPKSLPSTPQPVATRAIIDAKKALPSGRSLTAAEQSLARAQDNINFYHARFEIKVVDHQQKQTILDAAGQVWLANDRRYRVHYDRPEQQVLVSNGKKRWLFLPKINQVQVQAMPPEGNPTEFFLELGGGLSRLLQSCRATVRQEDERFIYTLRPLSGQQLGFNQAIIWTKGKDKLPVKLVVEAERQITVLFTPIQVKLGKQQMTKTEEEKFHFIAPKDAEMIEMFWPMK